VRVFEGLQAFEGLQVRYPRARNVQGLGAAAIDRPMLCFLDHGLLYGPPFMQHPDARRLPVRHHRPSPRCPDGDETKALIAFAKPPDPTWPPSPRRRVRPLRPMPAQPRELAPDLGVLARHWKWRNIQILRWRWGLDGERFHTWKEIGQKLHISAGRAAEIHIWMMTWLKDRPTIVIKAGLEMGLWDQDGQQREDFLYFHDNWQWTEYGGPMRWEPGP
jgi:hypothetical protein